MQQTIQLVLVGLLGTGAAFAQEQIDFDSHDADQDGYLTPGEWNDVDNVAVEFDAIDTNRDGRLSEAEVKAGVATRDTEQISGQSDDNADYTGTSGSGQDQSQGRQQRRTITSNVENQQRDVAMYDSDNDERVSRSEAQKDGELVTHFIIWDINQDGFLDQNEIDMGTMQADRQQEQQSGNNGSQGEGAASFEQADRNGDGRVSRKEANDANAEFIVMHFDVIDANQDGYVDRNEVNSGASNRDVNETGAGNTTRFETYDVDNDGFLDEDEAREDEHVDTNFDTWDANADGRLDENEVGPDWAAWDKDAFDTYDANDDGLLDEQEIDGHDYVNDNFDTWDTDRDGYLSEDEADTSLRNNDNAGVRDGEDW